MGGLHYVASHMSTDLTRLVPDNHFIHLIASGLLHQPLMIMDMKKYLQDGLKP